METRSKKQVYLLGDLVTQMTGYKLPSIGMSLKFFLYHHTELKATVREASKITLAEIAKFWEKARIPMRDPQHCQKKLEQLFEEWVLLKKNKGRKTSNQNNKEYAFSSKLDNLFDIAHANALDIIKIAEDRDFLLAQREDGRRGSMTGVDRNLFQKEMLADEKKNILNKRLQKLKDSQKEVNAVVVWDSSDSTDEDKNVSENEFFKEATPGPSKAKRGRYNIITPELAAALDRTKVTDRQALFVVAETAKSLGHDIKDINLNRSSIRRQRISSRIEQSYKLKEQLQTNVPLIVHWDGKLLPELTGKEKIDRLPVLVSGKGVTQLLSVAKLPSATGEAQAHAVYEALKDWNIVDRVFGMSFDTTSANSGKVKGACVLLEEKLEKKLFSFACHHHIMELIIVKVFEISLGTTSSPEVLLFKRFQGFWKFIDKDKFETGLKDDDVLSLVQDVKDEILEFAARRESAPKQRDDYKEFLELVIFLGGLPPRGIRFMLPGAIHHARWMSKVIYSLKIFMFKSQFKLTKKEESGLRDVCVFIVRVYFKAWMTASIVETSPYNDFQLMNSLLEYSKIHQDISKAAAGKFALHLWYLSEDLSALSF